MAVTTASFNQIGPDLALGIRRYEATTYGEDPRYIWMLEVRERTSSGNLYTEIPATAEALRKLITFAEQAIKTMAAKPEPSKEKAGAK